MKSQETLFQRYQDALKKFKRSSYPFRNTLDLSKPLPWPNGTAWKAIAPGYELNKPYIEYLEAREAYWKFCSANQL